VAEKAVVGEVLHAGANVFRRIGDGVLQAAVERGNRESPLSLRRTLPSSRVFRGR
jgi:hypothetical protein